VAARIASALAGKPTARRLVEAVRAETGLGSAMMLTTPPPHKLNKLNKLSKLSIVKGDGSKQPTASSP
jgi:hypothetical protein